MITELVFTAYNRPFYFKEVIESWNNVRNLQNWNASFFIEPSEIQDEMIELAFNLNTSVATLVNPERVGVLTNPWNALNDAFERGADFAVLAEDDVVVSQDILEFFEWTALEYQTGHNVLAVNAFSQLEDEGKTNQIILDNKFSPLIWGVWRNRWEDYLRDTWDKSYSTGNADGSEAGWDWNINRIIAANDLKIVKPLHSRSDHIGEFLGTHMTPDLFDQSRGFNFSQARGRFRYQEI
jgi:hypothetical protein